jgi:hypothetical protein
MKAAQRPKITYVVSLYGILLHYRIERALSRFPLKRRLNLFSSTLFTSALFERVVNLNRAWYIFYVYAEGCRGGAEVLKYQTIKFARRWGKLIRNYCDSEAIKGKYIIRGAREAGIELALMK